MGANAETKRKSYELWVFDKLSTLRNYGLPIDMPWCNTVQQCSHAKTHWTSQFSVSSEQSNPCCSPSLHKISLFKWNLWQCLYFHILHTRGGNNPKRNPMWWRGLSNDVMSCVKPFLFVVLCLWDAGRWHGWDCVRGKGAGFRVNPQWLPVRFLELLPAPEFRRSGFG